MTMQGEYTSVWDGGIEVISQVEVDLEEMRIVEFGERWLGEGSEDWKDVEDVEADLDVLEREVVYIPEVDKYYTACRTEELEWTEDEYGNGIVVYD